MLNKSDVSPEKKEAVVIKKYANRRLYNTETSTYVTLDDLAQMVRNDKDFVVYDAKSGDDLTHAVLTQIIVEQESREGGQTLLPIPFLRQLIRFYDDNIGSMVPSYLQLSLENLVKEQEKFRTMFASAFSNPAAAFEAYQDQARKNMAMFEQAMAMWTSFGGAANAQGKKLEPAGGEAAKPEATAEAPKGEIDELKAQLSAMQQRIERLAKDRE
ncbi:MAG TPA: polyhydroxyalkanoate synthesis repressor PhaR [Hyphomicrobium sp.]|nr:polyhydroxyalkanoate synthesis repressor PhaR [Hyphomicrobium sp.]